MCDSQLPSQPTPTANTKEAQIIAQKMWYCQGPSEAIGKI